MDTDYCLTCGRHIDNPAVSTAYCSVQCLTLDREYLPPAINPRLRARFEGASPALVWTTFDDQDGGIRSRSMSRAPLDPTNLRNVGATLPDDASDIAWSMPAQGAATRIVGSQWMGKDKEGILFWAQGVKGETLLARNQSRINQSDESDESDADDLSPRGRYHDKSSCSLPNATPTITKRRMPLTFRAPFQLSTQHIAPPALSSVSTHVSLTDVAGRYTDDDGFLTFNGSSSSLATPPTESILDFHTAVPSPSSTSQPVAVPGSESTSPNTTTTLISSATPQSAATTAVSLSFLTSNESSPTPTPSKQSLEEESAAYRAIGVVMRDWILPTIQDRLPSPAKLPQGLKSLALKTGETIGIIQASAPPPAAAAATESINIKSARSFSKSKAYTPPYSDVDDESYYQRKRATAVKKDNNNNNDKHAHHHHPHGAHHAHHERRGRERGRRMDRGRSIERACS